MKAKYFSISGYWKEDKEKFEDYIVKETEDVEKSEADDNLIFYYGLSEQEIIEAIALGENSGYDFVITSYKETTF
jgi:hypothetical protein